MVRRLCMQRPVGACVSDGQRGDGEDSRNGRERESITSDESDGPGSRAAGERRDAQESRRVRAAGGAPAAVVGF
jgi:hypothetical protein